MTGFNLYSSNDQRQLLSALADKIRSDPLTDPLETEKIVVHSYGMQRWVSMDLARELGILANVRFLFPNELLNLSYRTVLDDLDPDPLPEKDRLVWQLFEILSRSEDLNKYSEVATYLESAAEHKRFQLARRLAGLLDQYCMFRPDWILEWEAGKGDHWQAGVWKMLQQPVPSRHRPHFQKAFRDQIDSKKIETFAHRISIFGISSLPPIHIELLYHLSRFITVDMYFLNPSKQYWLDILSKKEISRIQRRRPGEELYFFEGNSLFASTGKAGKEFYHQLIDKNLIDDYGRDLFVERTQPKSLLEHIQQDIFKLREPDESQSIALVDRSVQIHICHSPMREVEVLHDQILHQLTSDPELQPDDIVVMCPDIEDYSAYIKAIFQAGESDVPRIPFSIADRSLRFESKPVESFFKLLDLLKSRISAAAVLELLEFEPLRAKFDLSESEVARIQFWITDANIRWGIDAAFRAETGTPPTYETTWEFGIDRILTGFAMPQNEEGYLEVEGQMPILPYDNIEGIESLSFGKFLEFYNRLKNAATAGPYRGDRRLRLEEWSETLKFLANSFFELGGLWDTEFDALNQSLEELTNLGVELGLSSEIQFETIYAHLHSRLAEQRSGLGFLGSGVTFCSMLPMRSIPFKVIVLLGMNDRVFPRVSSPLSFDLMTAERRLGDRSIKDEDRYIFLEAILSAENTLYISYVGQSIKDNSTIPPSTLVSELKYYIEKGYRLETGEDSETDDQLGKNRILEQIQVEHPLQAFSDKYFDSHQPKWLSFSGENLTAALEKNQKKDGIARFLSALPVEDSFSLDANQFARFFDNPSRYLLTHRLELYLEEDRELVMDQETFSLDPLERYSLQQELLWSAIEQEDTDLVQKKYQAKGVLPLADVGTLHYKDIAGETDTLFQSLKPYLADSQPQSKSYDFELDTIHFQGTLEDIWQGRLVRCRPARLKVRDRLKIWIEHLIYQIATDRPETSVLIMRDAKASKNQRKLVIYECPEILEPRSELSNLIRYFKAGQTEPLAFFPQTAMIYLETLAKASLEKAASAAEGHWYGNDFFTKGEFENPYIAVCFRHLDLFQTGFEKIGQDILGPLTQVQVEV